MGEPNVEPQDNIKKRILKIEALNADAIGILQLLLLMRTNKITDYS
jgi:hypothetical protein